MKQFIIEQFKILIRSFFPDCRFHESIHTGCIITYTKLFYCSMRFQSDVNNSFCPIYHLKLRGYLDFETEDIDSIASELRKFTKEKLWGFII